jgi:hypothetical protein
MHNARVYMGVRSREKAEAAIKDIKESTGKEALFLKLDLADLKAVKTAAKEFLRSIFLPLKSDFTPLIRSYSKETELHVLFNNG